MRLKVKNFSSWQMLMVRDFLVENVIKDNFLRLPALSHRFQRFTTNLIRGTFKGSSINDVTLFRTLLIPTIPHRQAYHASILSLQRSWHDPSLYGCDVIYGRPENMTLRTEFMKLHFRPKEQVLNTNTLYALLD